MQENKDVITRRKNVSPKVYDITNVGKIPPQAIDLEVAVLGAILIEGGSVIRIIDFLHPQCFYKEAHCLIFKAIKTLFERSEPVDILTVSALLKSTNDLDNVGGYLYITSLTNHVASGENIEYHARIILQKFIQRETIRSASVMMNKAYQDDTDIFDLLDTSQTELNELITGVMRRSEQDSTQLFGDFIKHLEVVAKSDSAMTGVPSRLTEVDSVLRGFQDSDLIIIAARPSMGKSASVKSAIKGCMAMQKPVLLFSLEMSARQCVARLMSEDTMTESQAFNSKAFLDKTDFNKLNQATTQYFDKDGKPLLYIDDTAALSINELMARAKLLHSKHNIKMIVVDYLQKVSASGENTVAQIENITWGLKRLAKELQMPVIALSQLNRECEKRSPPKPQLSDLRSSGAIEQDADVVIFLYRPEYYNIQELPEGGSTSGLCFWDIAKHRNGELRNVKVRFVGELTKFEDWSETGNLRQPQVYNAGAGIEENKEFLKPIVSKPDILDQDPF